jgi:hypothetical protein
MRLLRSARNDRSKKRIARQLRRLQTRRSAWQVPIGIAFLLGVAAGWAGQPAARTFTDPFAYCAAMGTIDRPDQPFKGRPPLAEVAAAFDIARELLNDRNVAWRCYNGAVYACIQLNSPICGRADTRRTPTAAMRAFCRGNPDSEVIPAVVIGHEHPPMYQWGCPGTVATITQQAFTPDPRGYPPDLWKKLSH